MSKSTTAPKTMVRLSNGDLVEVRGFGALKGKLKLTPGIDLTQPIYEQVIRKTAEPTSNGSSAIKRPNLTTALNELSDRYQPW